MGGPSRRRTRQRWCFALRCTGPHGRPERTAAHLHQLWGARPLCRGGTSLRTATDPRWRADRGACLSRCSTWCTVCFDRPSRHDHATRRSIGMEACIRLGTGVIERQLMKIVLLWLDIRNWTPSAVFDFLANERPARRPEPSRLGCYFGTAKGQPRIGAPVTAPVLKPKLLLLPLLRIVVQGKVELPASRKRPSGPYAPR